MISKSASIKNDGFDVFLQASFRHQRTNLLCHSDVCVSAALTSNLTFNGRGGCYGLTGDIIDDLRINVLSGEVDTQAGSFTRAQQSLANSLMPYLNSINIRHGIALRSLLDRLSFFSQDLLTDIANPLTLIRLGRIISPNVGSNLPDLLLINSFDQKSGVLLHSDLYSFRYIEYHRVRITQVQVQILTLHLSPKTYPMNFQFFLVTFTDSGDHILNQASRKAVQGSNATRLFGSL